MRQITETHQFKGDHKKQDFLTVVELLTQDKALLAKYQHYVRLVNVAWRGDISVLDYMGSEETVNWGGARLANAIDYLLEVAQDLEINIIAHSMGNRVLLKALDSLNQPEAINHIFMWDAAVPNTALSNQKSADMSLQRNCAFPNAAKTCKKITVLYSEDDKVLQDMYSLANKRYDQTTRFEDDLKYAVSSSQPEEIPATVLPALGSSGPDPYRKDPFVQGMINSGKLIKAKVVQNGQPKTEFGQMEKSVDETIGMLASHSYMIDPTPDIMKNVYQKFIVNKIRGLTKFSQYDSSQFPDG